MLHPMDAELISLEASLGRLIERYQAAREENRALQQELAVLRADNQELRSRIEATALRVEHLMASLPEELP